MEDIKVKISKETRKILEISNSIIGNDGENLQGNLVFSFEDEFVDGQARIETEIDGNKAYQILTKENEEYKIPIKSTITKSGRHNFQLVITEGTDINEIPIFKSNMFVLKVDHSINALIEQPDEYPTWIEIANAKLNQIDEKIEEVDTAVEQVNNAVERVDEGLSDLTHANEEAREIVSNFESNVEQYTIDFNTNAENKTSTFNSNYETKLSLFNSNASERTTEYDNNANSKLSDYNENADSKLSSYNTNASSKLNAYNSNASTKTSEYNTNATSKLNEYNTNAETKLSNYNTNASDKLDSYNSNADSKLDEYNQNASEKIEEYDNHVAEMQKTINKLEDRVDDLEDNQITLPAEGTNIHVEDAAKARLYEFGLNKESTQDNIAYIDVGEWEQGNINASTGANESNTSRVRTKDYIPIKSGVLYTLTRTIATSFNTYRFYDSSKNYIGSNVDVDMTSSLTTKNMISESTQQITINNTNVAYLRIVDVSNDINTIYTISTENTPSPDYPQEVKVVEGYRNLFDKNSFNSFTSSLQQLQLILKPNTTYTMSSNILYDTPSLANLFIHNSTTSPSTTTNGIYDGKTVNVTTNSDGILIIEYRNNHGSLDNYNPINDFWYFLIEGDQELPYVPYGNNYIAVNVSDGNTTNSYPIPLNNNIIAGIGDYKDELLVDKSGHVFINKKTGKVVLNGTENWEVNIYSPNTYSCSKPSDLATGTVNMLCNLTKNFKTSTAQLTDYGIVIGSVLNYKNISISDLNELKTELETTNLILYYPISNSQLIDLNTTVDLKLFKGVNNITNSEDGNMRIRYVESIESVISELRNAILEIGGGE